MPLYHIHFASDRSLVSEDHSPVPRLEIVLEGEAGVLHAHNVLFIPAGGKLLRPGKTSVTLLSLMFGKQQLTLLHQHIDNHANHCLTQHHVARRGPRIGSFLLHTLTELQMQPDAQETARLVVLSLLSHCRDLLGSDIHTASRSQVLFDAIRTHIEENYASALTSESVALAFYISPNYLSHLFQHTGGVGFNEYLTRTRLEHARQLLKGYDLNVKAIAHVCGFTDSNYFCRLFRKHTERSPSEYRRQYHSQITAKN